MSNQKPSHHSICDLSRIQDRGVKSALGELSKVPSSTLSQGGAKVDKCMQNFQTTEAILSKYDNLLNSKKEFLKAEDSKIMVHNDSGI